jgi:DNA-binding LacI/PurR family transcriptional regulator
MPGVLRLEAELGVNRKTVEAGLRRLERDGLLVSQGPGRRRRIATKRGRARGPALRLVILLGESADNKLHYMVDLLHSLEEDGHTVSLAPRTQAELGKDLARVRNMVRAVPADAWVIMGGSRELLAWFAAQRVPAFALFGRYEGLPIAGVKPHKAPIYRAIMRTFVELGHRRVVILARPDRRLPVPGESEQAALDELRALGIATGPYNLPDWTESIDGLHAGLEHLFAITPPTAMLIDEVEFFVATQIFLMNHGLRIPQDISLVCSDGHPHFDWCRPSIAHIRWDSRPVIRRILRWASNVGRARRDIRKSYTSAKLIPGGTIGPAPALV